MKLINIYSTRAILFKPFTTGNEFKAYIPFDEGQIFRIQIDNDISVLSSVGYMNN